MPPSIRLYEQTGRAGKSPDEALILENLGMVKRIAVHLKARIPPFMEVDELVQVGMLGLIEAARGYDPRRGIPFEHFALSRVRGSMLDEVRRVWHDAAYYDQLCAQADVRGQEHDINRSLDRFLRAVSPSILRSKGMEPNHTAVDRSFVITPATATAA